jgi:hypothetical protein
MISIWRNVSARFFCIVLKAAAPASDLRLSMSGMGQEQTSSGQAPMSALPPKADIRQRE